MEAHTQAPTGEHTVLGLMNDVTFGLRMIVEKPDGWNGGGGPASVMHQVLVWACEEHGHDPAEIMRHLNYLVTTYPPRGDA